jgi:hypothetical protein
MERALQRDNRKVRKLRGLLQMVRSVANLRVRPLRCDNKRKQHKTADVQDDEDEEESDEEGNKDEEESIFVKDDEDN